MSDTKTKFDIRGAISKGKIAQPLRVLLYGQEGFGKTFLCSDAPRTLLLGSEEGSAHYDVSRITPDCWLPFVDPDTKQPRGAQPLLKIVEWFGTPEAAEYQTLAIDTIDAAEKMAIEYVCARDHGTNDPAKRFLRETWVDGKPNPDGYPYAGVNRVVETEFIALLAALDRVRRARNVHVVFTAHSDVAKEKNQSGDDYGVIAPRLTKYARDQVVAWCDAVLYGEFSRTEIQSADHDKRGRQVGKAKVVTDGSRVVHTTRNRDYIAKNRLGLPEHIELGWAPIAEGAQKTYGDSAEQVLRLRAEIEQMALLAPEETRAKVAELVEKHASSVLMLIGIKGKLQARLAEAQPGTAPS